MAAGERKNQKQRTRTAVVNAAVRLLQAGKSPTVSEVARTALVSPATAYRYFPNAQSLWQAVLQAIGEPYARDVFEGLEKAGLEARVTAMIDRVGGRMLDNEAIWRTAHAIQFEPSSDGNRIPLRTGQRLRWIEEALAPAQRKLGKRQHARLKHALALVIGADAMITLRDVCRLSAREAKQVSVWAGQALVRAAETDRS
jgi:AcrR family transcriptional regulator